MVDDGSAATAMLGLPGFVLIAVSELEDEIEQAVQTTADLVGCPACGAVAVCHGRRPVRVRDLPSAGRAVTLIWLKRLWRCEHAECDVNTSSERSQEIRPRSSLTERARKEACRRVGRDGHTVSQVAAQFGVGWATIMKAVTEYGLPAVDDPARLDGVRTLGVDETAFTAAGPRRATTFATGIVDMSGPTARLLDVVPGQSGKALAQWISHRPPGWAEQVQVAALDPFRGYATALTAALPTAVRVLDCFHVDPARVRRRGRRPPPGATRFHRAPRPQGRTAVPDPPGAAPPRRPPQPSIAWQRLMTGLALGDVDQQIGRTWIAAQELRRIYTAPNREVAAERLYRWMTFCVDTGIPELRRLARTIDSWREELLAYFDTGGVSNGPTEATNLLIKKVKRSGHGFRNFDNYRLRLILNCGVTWQDHNPTPLRGHSPRLTA